MIKIEIDGDKISITLEMEYTAVEVLNYLIGLMYVMGFTHGCIMQAIRDLYDDVWDEDKDGYTLPESPNDTQKYKVVYGKESEE